MIYTKKNFFRNTYCEFISVEFDFSMVEYHQSKSGSRYHYTNEGVYRYSNHWGRVADCRWKLKGLSSYKNQNWYVGFAKWSAFYDLSSSDVCFCLSIDWNSCKVTLNVVELSEGLFTLQQALKRIKEIESVLKNDSFLKYYENPEELRFFLLTKLVNTKKTLFKIKLELIGCL